MADDKASSASTASVSSFDSVEEAAKRRQQQDLRYADKLANLISYYKDQSYSYRLTSKQRDGEGKDSPRALSESKLVPFYGNVAKQIKIFEDSVNALSKFDESKKAFKHLSLSLTTMGNFLNSEEIPANYSTYIEHLRTLSKHHIPSGDLSSLYDDASLSRHINDLTTYIDNLIDNMGKEANARDEFEFEHFLKIADETFKDVAFSEKELIEERARKQAYSGLELAQVIENIDKKNKLIANYLSDKYKDVELSPAELGGFLKAYRSAADLVKIKDLNTGVETSPISDDDQKYIQGRHSTKPYKASEIANFLKSKVEFYTIYQKYTKKNRFKDTGEVDLTVTPDGVNEFEEILKSAKYYASQFDYVDKGGNRFPAISDEYLNNLRQMHAKEPFKGSNLVNLLKSKIDSAKKINEASDIKSAPDQTYVKHGYWAKTTMKDPLKTGIGMLDDFLKLVDPLVNKMIEFGVPQYALLGPAGLLLSPKVIGAAKAFVANRKTKYDKNLKANAAMAQILSSVAKYGLVEPGLEVVNTDAEAAQKLGLAKITWDKLLEKMPQAKDGDGKDKPATPPDPELMKAWLKTAMIYLEGQPKISSMLKDSNDYANTLELIRQKATALEGKKAAKHDIEVVGQLDKIMRHLRKNKEYPVTEQKRARMTVLKNKGLQNEQADAAKFAAMTEAYKRSYAA